ncbi:MULTISPECIES: DUF6397 family protein [unclassified Streptomyces]|uniref:DUF6397 family protein n=1 Tax=unclassified Streptomyces TaxID=2593676 RepID=UPI002DDAD4CE|nr:DUF6397 family protein [Streptomyces sp. NBC_00243]WRZ24407.1 DUF6397 family protein [Streptomyces sp. NBC_00243]
MSGNTITTIDQSATSVAGISVSATPGTAPAEAGARRPPLALSRAARELDLKRGEFDLAVQLGCVRTIPDEGGGGRRVSRTEIDRVRSEHGYPEALRDRVKAVGTREGAALMEVTTARFTRLARLGLVVPVKFYLNRYRAVVWLYLAEELRQFAADKDNAPLLSGRTPEGLRDQLDEGLDLRPRNWRGRHMGFLLRQTEDPWERAAVVASLLDPVQVAEIVRDPYERAHLNRCRPERASHGAPDSPAAHTASRIMTADDADEISWLRADLGQLLTEARDLRPAPRPAPRASRPAVPRPGPALGPPNRPAAEGPERPRKLLGWLRRKNP